MKWLKNSLLVFVWIVASLMNAHATEPAIQETLRTAEARHEIPIGLLDSLCWVESRHHSTALGDHGKGIGLCQVHAATVTEVNRGNPYLGSTKLFAKGAIGSEVVAIQTALVRAGAYSLPIDGVFGPITTAAVRSFQSSQPNLKIDGIVGPKTWGSLGLGSYPGQSITQALWDAETNADWAARILRYRFEQCGAGSWALAIAAYNGGCGNGVVVHTQRVLNRWGGKIITFGEQ